MNKREYEETVMQNDRKYDLLFEEYMTLVRTKREGMQKAMRQEDIRIVDDEIEKLKTEMIVCREKSIRFVERRYSNNGKEETQ